MAEDTIGLRIMKIRKARGMNQARLSQKAGIDPAQLNRIERGIITDPRVRTVELIAKGLEVPTWRLLLNDDANIHESLLKLENENLHLNRKLEKYTILLTQYEEMLKQQSSVLESVNQLRQLSQEILEIEEQNRENSVISQAKKRVLKNQQKLDA